MPKVKKAVELSEKRTISNLSITDLVEKYKQTLGPVYSGVFLLGFIMGALIASVVTIYFIRVPRDNDANSATISAEDQIRKDECIKAGGSWQSTSSGYTCNSKTSDSGKTCNSKSECFGWCLAKDDAKINTKASGTCSDKTIMQGCIKFIDNGLVNSICLPK